MTNQLNIFFSFSVAFSECDRIIAARRLLIIIALSIISFCTDFINFNQCNQRVKLFVEMIVNEYN